MSFPITTITVLQYATQAQFQAFSRMGRFFMKPFREEGLLFCKLMGSGQAFGLKPDLSRYVFLAVWENLTYAEAFLQTATCQTLEQGALQCSTVFLQTIRSHGLWNSQNPFVRANELPVTQALLSERTPNSTILLAEKQPLAVLTRATIRPAKLIKFWRHVPQVRQRLQRYQPDLLFAIGVGELPIVQQCTISIWRNSTALSEFAYQESGHKEVVRLSRQNHWFSEELFARFTVLKATGGLFADIRDIMSAI